MEYAEIASTFADITVTVALGIWIMAERRDNDKLWSIVESLVKLRLKQVEDLQDTTFVELD